MRFIIANIKKAGLILFGVFLIHSCSVKKFIPEGELLYTGADLEIRADSSLKELEEVRTEITNVLQPKPNSKFLGMRPGLYFHYKAQREKPGFINRFLNKKIGEEPVYLSDVDIPRTEDLILNRLENRGFFYSRVGSSVTEKEKNKTASVNYKSKLPEPYRLETYQLDSDSLIVYQELKDLIKDTPIEKGMRFDLPSLKMERERLDNELKKRGYYNFNPDFLIFEADTNQYKKKKFDLFLRLKKDVPSRAQIPYKISKVNVHPNYVVNNDSQPKDTTRFDNKNFIQDEVFFKPKRLAPYLLIDEEEFYNPVDSRNTSRRIASIGAYKFVNIRYDEIDTLATDSLGILEANIFLSPLKKRAVRAELQAVTKSNDFAGPSLALTFSNRNLFHGGETLNITGKVGYEVQVGGTEQSGLNSLQLGLETELIFPRLLFPVPIENNWFKYDIPKTRIGLEGNYLSRSKLFTLASLGTNFGYFWNANRFVTHELNPISVNYVNLMKTSDEFDTILSENPYLKSSFDQQFIAGLTYSFTYYGHRDLSRKHTFFLNSTLDIAGNTIDLISGHSDQEPQTFLGLEYAQYVKADADFSYHMKTGREQLIAARLFAGYGLPYGNSEVMPFTKQYYAGGPYSIRAFNTRSLGPGTYDPESEAGAYFDQSGNLRLEANLEYRFPIYSYLKGAAFIDAGNVWNTKDNKDIEGDRFSSDFINELGIGTGIGLRIDIQSFVIRFDLAAPIHDPSLAEGERWKFGYKKPVLNFAIGYPF
ncbi:translocation and assembly module lipoprotein TamL [Salegentibacter chungangensis]|uniref:BamA/TamA family outer membrane protein n=1 Tax=Salegentibacter chungangensis TaxID=1335724 RepID=A0ABW3NT15_9FLAO